VPPDPDPWPRPIQLSDATLTVYQPQVERWQGNQLSFRAAVAAKASGSNAETFGVVWGSARTEVDRVARRVTLEDLRLARSNFPTLPDNGAAYLSELQQQFQVLWYFPECTITIIAATYDHMSMSYHVEKSVKQCARPLRSPSTSPM
jgi:hypothetical protein